MLRPPQPLPLTWVAAWTRRLCLKFFSLRRKARQWTHPHRPLIDRFTRRSKQAYALVPAVSPMFLNYSYLASAVTLVQEEVRPDQRVISGALLLLIMNLIGLAFGPTFVGAVSDFFHASHPHHSLQIGLYMLAPSYLVATFLFLVLARVLRNESHTTGEVLL